MFSEATAAGLKCAVLEALREGVINTPFNDVRAAARALVEDIFATSAGALNSTRPVYRMPPELLTVTFLTLDFADRVSASHVCRAWRTAALGCPALWSDIRVRLHPGGRNAARVHCAVSMLVARTGSAPIRFTQVFPAPGFLSRIVAGPPAAVALDLAVLLPHLDQLHGLSIALLGNHFLKGWQPVVERLPGQLRSLSLSLTRATCREILARCPTLLPCSLPLLHTLDLAGEIEDIRKPLPALPALKQLSIRANRQWLSLDTVVDCILSACPVLEKLMLVAFSGIHSCSKRPVRPTISSLVLRGQLGVNDVAREALYFISVLGCERAAHIAMQQESRGQLPEYALWGDDAFRPTELTVYQPVGKDRFGRVFDKAVAQLRDAEGRTRSFILHRWLGYFLDKPSFQMISRLTIDERYVDTASYNFTPGARMLPTLETLEIRLFEHTPLEERLFVPMDDGSSFRLTERAESWDGVWACTALQHVEIAYGGPIAHACLLCADVARLLDCLGAPHSVSLTLRNLDILEVGDNQAYGVLQNRVSHLAVGVEYLPMPVEEDWVSWRVADDGTIP